MSVHAVERASGSVFEVRWRTTAGAQRSRRFDTEDAAVEFDAAVLAHVALERAETAWHRLPVALRRAALKANNGS